MIKPNFSSLNNIVKIRIGDAKQVLSNISVNHGFICTFNCIRMKLVFIFSATGSIGDFCTDRTDRISRSGQIGRGRQKGVNLIERKLRQIVNCCAPKTYDQLVTKMVKNSVKLSCFKIHDKSADLAKIQFFFYLPNIEII